MYVWFVAYGWASSMKKVTASNRFRIASVTKVFTAAAIMKLVEEGKLSLSAKAFGPKGTNREACTLVIEIHFIP